MALQIASVAAFTLSVTPLRNSMSSCCPQRVLSCGVGLMKGHGDPRSTLGAPRGSVEAPSGFFWQDPPGPFLEPALVRLSATLVVLVAASPFPHITGL